MKVLLSILLSVVLFASCGVFKGQTRDISRVKITAVQGFASKAITAEDVLIYKGRVCFSNAPESKNVQVGEVYEVEYTNANNFMFIQKVSNGGL